METKSPGRKMRTIDDESAIALYHGLNLSQMARLFEMDKRDITAKLEQNGIKPVGMNMGVPIYKLKEVMPVVVKPLYDIETFLRRMNPNDLPKHLSKEFWAGQRAKQEYELRNGDLWPTTKVVSEVGELFKLVKMSALLAVDSVERQVELTDEQRNIIKRTMDGMLVDLHRTVVEKFSSREPDNGTATDEDF